MASLPVRQLSIKKRSGDSGRARRRTRQEMCPNLVPWEAHSVEPVEVDANCHFCMLFRNMPFQNKILFMSKHVIDQFQVQIFFRKPRRYLFSLKDWPSPTPCLVNSSIPTSFNVSSRMPSHRSMKGWNFVFCKDA